MLFTDRFKKIIASAMSAVIAISSVFSVATPAHAQSSEVPTCDPYAAKAGQQPECSVLEVGGIPYAFPKVNWQKVAELPIATTNNSGNVSIAGTSEAQLLANRMAMALGITSDQVASAAAYFPTNVPFVFGRYNPLNGELRVDIFKVERAYVNGMPVAVLLAAPFTPAHGDWWRANRAYIEPSLYQGGVTPGVNPFSAFHKPGSPLFHNIPPQSEPVARVAMGHAMRLVGAPFGLYTVAETRFTTKTKKSGGVFKKKVETWVYGHAKPRWYFAAPAELLSTSGADGIPQLCAPDPTKADCPVYETASAGVVFEHFEGGTLSDFEDKWEVDYQKKSGWTFLGALVLGGLFSFGLSGLMGSAFTSSATAAAAPTGIWGPLAVSQGFVSGTTLTLATSVGIELAAIGSLMVLGGANLGGVYSVGLGIPLGITNTIKLSTDTWELSKYEKRLAEKIKPRTDSKLGGVAVYTEEALTGVEKTVRGDCAVNNTGCGMSGVLPRMETLTQTNQYKFYRDNGGEILRTETPYGPR